MKTIAELFSLKNKTFIIAELSANHGHDIQVAKETIKAAKESGADAVKIQTYTADTLTIDSEKEYFKLNSGTIWDGRTLYDLYSEAYMPWEWHAELRDYAESLGMLFFSTPFDKTAVDYLEEMENPIYKVASFEIMDLPLLEYIASKGKPIILSTGVAELSDIEAAIKACKKQGNDQIVLLKTTSAYPALIEDANLATMKNMKETFGCEVGISDHTVGATVPIVSVVLGGSVIEKHFILDQSIGGPDASFSMEPAAFKQMVEAVREAEKSVGQVDYAMNEKKKSNRVLARSLFFTKDVKAGEELTEDNVRSIRPGNGLSPKHLPKILGKKAATDVEKGTPVAWQLIQ